MRAVDLDDRDCQILADRTAALDARKGVREGDFVRFSDGVLRRASYIWRDENGTILSVQTSDGGSFHLGASGYVSFSGGLYPGVPPETLHEENGLLLGRVWFFHHDWWKADNGVECQAWFRVYTCSLPSN